jgi:hypothetical protein
MVQLVALVELHDRSVVPSSFAVAASCAVGVVAEVVVVVDVVAVVPVELVVVGVLPPPPPPQAARKLERTTARGRSKRRACIVLSLVMASMAITITVNLQPRNLDCGLVALG